MDKRKKGSCFWLALTLFSLMGQIAWVVENMYLNVFIYETFNATPDHIWYMVAASAVTAALTTVFMGALSDKIGKRKLTDREHVYKKCPHCRAQLRLPRKKGEHDVCCPRCKVTFSVKI